MVSGRAPGSSCHFFTIVARDTNDQTFAASRQRFLAERGHAYTIVDREDVRVAADQRRREDQLDPSRQLPAGEGPLAW